MVEPGRSYGVLARGSFLVAHGCIFTPHLSQMRGLPERRGVAQLTGGIRRSKSVSSDRGRPSLLGDPPQGLRCPLGGLWLSSQSSSFVIQSAFVSSPPRMKLLLVSPQILFFQDIFSTN